jgi:hypothetical protein
VTVDTRMIEVEQAERHAATEARLDDLRGQLGLAQSESAEPADTAGTTAAGTTAAGTAAAATPG